MKNETIKNLGSFLVLFFCVTDIDDSSKEDGDEDDGDGDGDHWDKVDADGDDH